MFWFEIGSGFGEPGGTPPPRIPKSHHRFEYNVGWFISVILLFYIAECPYIDLLV